MKERPILFSGPMVRAVLAGTKTQTRRVVKLKHYHQIEERDDGSPWPWMYDGECKENSWIPCPYGQPAVVDSGHRIGGDRLYVREALAAPHAYDHLPPRLIPQDARIHYAATEDRGGLLWRPSIHMPRWASRITLELTGVRVECLQDISEADARAEGVTDGGCLNCGESEPCGCPAPAPDARDAFARLWMSINGSESWLANPWVWVLEFCRINSKEIEHAAE